MNKKSNIVSVVFLIITIVALISVLYFYKENQASKIIIKNQQVQMNSRLQIMDDENKELIQKNQKLIEENQKLIDAFNEKQRKIREQSSRGTSRPSRSGITPRFTLTNIGKVDHYKQQTALNNLSDHLYQSKKIEVLFDVDDYNSWPDLGEWYVSCYTATVGECDANPSITASGKLVTPDFTVAVDNNIWPFGTIFYFENLGFGIAADTGPNIRGKNRADFLVGSKKFAYATTGNYKVRLVYEPNK